MEFHTFSLPNGIRVIHKQTAARTGHCGLIINAGSRDEKPHQQGLAHFIEHCIFKGTERRKTFHILSRLDSVGGEINAYTTKEHTCVYASFLDRHLSRAVDLIADICFHSTFPEKEMRKERDVIIDEIHSYRDTPAEMIFDDFEEQVFSRHSIGRNILGTEESVRKLSREDVFDLIGRRYRTDQMVFASVGPASPARIKKVAERFFGEVPASAADNDRTPFRSYYPQQVEVEREVHQTHLMMGNMAYHAGEEKKTGLVLLNNLLGGPAMNSRLNLHVREKHGIAYHIESSYTAYSDTGLFQIYLGTDDRVRAKAEQLVLKELKSLRDKKLGTTQLHMAKQQLIGQIALNQESGSGTMLTLGKSFLMYGKVDSLDEVYHRIEAISAEELLEIANEILSPDALSTLVFRPGKT